MSDLSPDNSLPNIIQMDEWKKKIQPQPQGKGPTPPDNWLLKLKKGTVFLCQDPTSILLKEFHLSNMKGKAVLLFDNVSPIVDNFLWVDSDSFCLKFKLFEILQEGEEP